MEKLTKITLDKDHDKPVFTLESVAEWQEKQELQEKPAQRRKKLKQIQDRSNSDSE